MTIKKLSRILKKSFSILFHQSDYVQGETYYPDCIRKTRRQILADQLFFIWKYGDVEPFYYTYGFDRLEISRDRMIREYIIPYKQFQRKVNKLNFQNPRYDSFHGKLTGRVITGDKFYFYVFLERFCIPTPKVYCFIKDRTPLYIDPRFDNSEGDAILRLRCFLRNDMDAFAKPSDGQLGEGIFSLRVQNGSIFFDGKLMSEIDAIEKLLSADYLIQERIQQHPALNALCPSSINSIRLQTVMDTDGSVHAFGAGLRIGRRGSSVDNWAKGGVFVGIDMNSGSLFETGFLKPQFGTSVKIHPDTQVSFKDYVIPFYKEAESMALKLHRYLYRCHSIGWDIAITENGPVFIEGNGLWEISLLQAAHGGLKEQIEKYFNV